MDVCWLTTSGLASFVLCSLQFLDYYFLSICSCIIIALLFQVNHAMMEEKTIYKVTCTGLHPMFFNTCTKIDFRVCIEIGLQLGMRLISYMHMNIKSVMGEKEHIYVLGSM